ncbi:putative RNA helicase [Helianthus annuus]|uniref:RNA helicase n=1 Tax=Helianthus annuus TaxID=4232 RepID=A0A9K3JHG4_HELAN|nr:eukaryotic initiation factor 4A-15 isoform X4 [Helianthus annuus]KAF5815011.1 putative RNA helicase [Helianthus annuus]
MVGWHRHVQSILLHVGKRAENICYTHATFSTSPLKFSPLQVMAGAAPEGSQFDTRHFDSKMNELISTDGQDFFTSYDEVYDIFDAMGLQENLLRGIYAYGTSFYSSCGRGCLQTS